MLSEGLSNFIAIIPARYASTRFPAKPLVDIAGKPMVVRVAELAAQSGAQQVVVAIDDQRIADVLMAHRVDYLMTSTEHLTGTDRLAQVVDLMNLHDDQIVVNVQGDEPLLDPALIRSVADELLLKPDCAMATAAYRITCAESVFNPNVVKVVLDANRCALYFSRAPIPWARDLYAREHHVPIDQKSLPAGPAMLHHIGIYAYRAGFLRQYPKLEPAQIEQLESLEQLRALWHGYKIAVCVTDNQPAPGVDHPQDLETVLALWQQKNRC